MKDKKKKKKKTTLDYIKAIRGSWLINPITRVKESDKKDKKKRRQEEKKMEKGES